MHIETITQKLKSDIIRRAHEVGCTQQEITVLEEAEFFEDAESEIRRELAAFNIINRRAIRAVSYQQNATRGAPSRSAKKASASGGGYGGDDSDGPGPWSSERIDHDFSIGALPILSLTFRDRGTGEFSRYRGPTLLPRLPNTVISIVARGIFPDRKLTISWCDAASGRHGEGVVKLVAAILKIPESEAADLIVRFYANARAACGGGESVDQTIARFRRDYRDPYLRRTA